MGGTIVRRESLLLHARTKLRRALSKKTALLQYRKTGPIENERRVKFEHNKL